MKCHIHKEIDMLDLPSPYDPVSGLMQAVLIYYCPVCSPVKKYDAITRE